MYLQLGSTWLQTSSKDNHSSGCGFFLLQMLKGIQIQKWLGLVIENGLQSFKQLARKDIASCLTSSLPADIISQA
ncbi:hypothetical protein CH063_12244, partial [Colletotrichum higginsianum]